LSFINDVKLSRLSQRRAVGNVKRVDIRNFAAVNEFPKFVSPQQATALLQKASSARSQPNAQLADYVINTLHQNGGPVTLQQCHLHLVAHARSKSIKGCWESVAFIKKVGLNPKPETYEIVSWAICFCATRASEIEDLLASISKDGLSPSPRTLSLLVRAAARLRDVPVLVSVLDRLITDVDCTNERFSNLLPDRKTLVDLRGFYKLLKDNLHEEMWKHPEMVELLLGQCRDIDDALFIVCQWHNAEITSEAIEILSSLLEKNNSEEVSKATFRRSKEILDDALARGLASDRFLSALALFQVWGGDIDAAFRAVGASKNPSIVSTKFLDRLAMLCVTDVSNFKDLVHRIKDALMRMKDWKREQRAALLAAVVICLEKTISSKLLPQNVMNDHRLNMSIAVVQTLHKEGVDVREFLTPKR